MLKKTLSLSVMAFTLLLLEAALFAEIRPEKIHVADGKKNQIYLHNGLIIGGDKAVDSTIIQDIRRATNRDFERIVIDLEGSKNGEPLSIQRPSYFQVAIAPEERRLTITFWGKPKLSFHPAKVLAAFHRSAVIQSIQLLPQLENDSWTFAFELKSENPVEVFELSHPVRVIIDIQRKKK